MLVLLLLEIFILVYIISCFIGTFSIIFVEPISGWIIVSWILGSPLLNIGDRVFTSGDGNVFPSDILIGNIFLDNKKKLRVKPVANFESLEVLRILNTRKIVADWTDTDLVGMENF